MSTELLNSIATLGTFVVIAATALAALVQLRHMRGSNQIAALSDLYEKDTACPRRCKIRHFAIKSYIERRSLKKSRTQS
jgi:hypothetical protein